MRWGSTWMVGSWKNHDLIHNKKCRQCLNETYDVSECASLSLSLGQTTVSNLHSECGLQGCCARTFLQCILQFISFRIELRDFYNARTPGICGVCSTIMCERCVCVLKVYIWVEWRVTKQKSKMLCTRRVIYCKNVTHSSNANRQPRAHLALNVVVVFVIKQRESCAQK